MEIKDGFVDRFNFHTRIFIPQKIGEARRLVGKLVNKKSNRVLSIKDKMELKKIEKYIFTWPAAADIFSKKSAQAAA